MLQEMRVVLQYMFQAFAVPVSFDQEKENQE